MEHLMNYIITIASLITALGVILAFGGKIKNFLVGDIKIGLKRLELLDMIHHAPKNVITICALYDEYKKLGGNSYIDEIFKEREENNK